MAKLSGADAKSWQRLRSSAEARTFDKAALIESSLIEARGATVGKEIVQMPWESRVLDYTEREGMRVPSTGEAAWLTPHGRSPLLARNDRFGDV